MPADPKVTAVAKLIFGYDDKRKKRLRQRGLQFSHYATAEVAAQILLRRNVWMRNTSSMNDYMEFTFGSERLKTALQQHRRRLTAAIDVARTGLLEETLNWLNQADWNRQHHTFMTCFSEHRPNDDLGLLSMWRAYGGPVAGVALIMNTDFLDLDTDILSAWSSPVLYGEAAFMIEFEAMINRLEHAPELLKDIDPNILKSITFNALRFAILSAKHIGFREEREWRIIHGPREFASAWLQPTFETVRGKPEVVYHLPLQNLEGMNLPEIDIRRLLNRIIIGPCQNPYQVASTFSDILLTLGFENSNEYIRISNIPLRQPG